MQTNAAEYYKWVDAKGVTHYSKTPPPASAKKKSKVETYGWHNSAPTTSSTSASNETQSNTSNTAEAPTKAPSEAQPINIPQAPASTDNK
ncbi:DUF4124 domain-containing protein [Acinetobacter sp. NCu2D-2]|uniref:DUF4124 domain-containing protein n=1 Tax=Acinetobacter sp. NCu2D-2 TaxID=1608473 RepID=UPI003FA41810